MISPSSPRIEIGPHSRIAIIRLSALGDVILTLPVASALRENFPQAYIAWVVEKQNAPLLAGHPAIDKIIPIPKKWYASWKTFRTVWREMRQQRFQVAIDVQSLSKSGLLAWLSGAKTRVAFARPQGRELAPWLATHRIIPEGTHVVDIFLSILRPFGIEPPAPHFQTPETPEETAWADAALRDLNLSPGSFAVVNPGAAWACKRWPFDRYANVAQFLHSAFGLPTVVLWGNAQERTWAERISSLAGPFCRVAPKTDLRQMAALLRRARLMISADTGPLHLAAALGVPCVGLYGPTDPARVGPLKTPHRVVQALRYQGRHPRRAPLSLMEAITPEMVCTACAELLRQGQAE